MPRVSDPQDRPSAGQSSPSNGKTIFIAEDDPFISRMYGIKLKGAGYEVVTADNGRDAYEQIKAVHPDLIMMDINMPELTGFEVIRALKADGDDSLLKNIIVLTNSANPDDRKTAADMGIDYMVKAELTPREVLEQINQKLGVKG